MKLEIDIIRRFKGIIPDDRRVYTYHSWVGAMGYSKEGYLHYFILKSPKGISAPTNIGSWICYVDSDFNKTVDPEKAQFFLYCNRTLSKGTSRSYYAHGREKSYQGMSWFSFLETRLELAKQLVSHWVRYYSESEWY